MVLPSGWKRLQYMFQSNNHIWLVLKNILTLEFIIKTGCCYGDSNPSRGRERPAWLAGLHYSSALLLYLVSRHLINRLWNRKKRNLWGITGISDPRLLLFLIDGVTFRFSDCFERSHQLPGDRPRLTRPDCPPIHPCYRSDFCCCPGANHLICRI